MTHLINIGGGDQTLFFVPHKRASSAVFEILDPIAHQSGSSDRILVTGSATVDSYSSQVDTNCGGSRPEPRKVYVASTTNVTASYRYVISHGDHSGSECFTADGYFAGNYILSKNDLIGTYPTGSVVQGIQLSATFPAALASDTNLINRNNPLEIVWHYTIDGKTQRSRDLIRLVHHNQDDQGLDSIKQKIEDTFKGFTTRLPSGEVLDIIKSAKGMVRAKMLGRGIDPESYLTGEQGSWMLFFKAMELFAMMGNVPTQTTGGPEAFAEWAKTEFSHIWNDLTHGDPGLEVIESEPLKDQAVKGARRYRSIIEEG